MVTVVSVLVEVWVEVVLVVVCLKPFQENDWGKVKRWSLTEKALVEAGTCISCRHLGICGPFP